MIKSAEMRPVGPIQSRILLIRGEKVIVDSDLAEFYGVTTKALNQAVRRNKERFPADFIFQLTKAEKTEVVTNCEHLKKLKFSPVNPYAFTGRGNTVIKRKIRDIGMKFPGNYLLPHLYSIYIVKLWKI